MGSLRSLHQRSGLEAGFQPSPLQFTCPVCGSHELVLVVTHIVGYEVAQINESGRLEYQPTIYSHDEVDREDCYFACGGYPDGKCDFTPHDPEDYPDDDPGDPDDRISDSYTMLQWIRDHQQTPAAE